MSPSNIFVLTTGRTGSMTFARASGHATNFSAGHETRTSQVGSARLAYPDRHIEVDNRLSWLLGELDERYGDDAGYVHLLRDEREVARSYLARWPYGDLGWLTRGERRPRDLARRASRQLRNIGVRGGIAPAFSQQIVTHDGVLSHAERLARCEMMAATMNANIRLFLKDKSQILTVHLEEAREGFDGFWERFGLEGDRGAALAEWDTSWNSTA